MNFLKFIVETLLPPPNKRHIKYEAKDHKPPSPPDDSFEAILQKHGIRFERAGPRNTACDHSDRQPRHYSRRNPVHLQEERFASTDESLTSGSEAPASIPENVGDVEMTRKSESASNPLEVANPAVPEGNKDVMDNFAVKEASFDQNIDAAGPALESSETEPVSPPAEETDLNEGAADYPISHELTDSGSAADVAVGEATEPVAAPETTIGQMESRSNSQDESEFWDELRRSKHDDFATALGALLQTNQDILAAVVLSARGHLLAKQFAMSNAAVEDLALEQETVVIAVALTELRNTILQNSTLYGLSELSLQSAKRTTMLFDASEKGMLVITARHDGNLGMILLDARETAGKIGNLLMASPAAHEFAAGVPTTV